MFAVFWAVAIISLITFLFIAARRRRREREEQQDQDRAAIEDGKARGILLSSGRPACIVCKVAEATETWPICDVSALDKVTLLKDVHALTPRYVVRDGGEEYRYTACRPCKRKAVQRWHEWIAQKRAQCQHLFSQIEGERSQLESGMLLAHLQTEHAESRVKLEHWLEERGNLLQLPLAAVVSHHDGPISMPPMNTKKEEVQE